MTEPLKGKRPLLIGVAGGTASGKTSICDLIARSLGIQCSVISTDSFYKGLTPEQIEDVANYNFDHPDAIDFDLIFEIIGGLMTRKTVQVPVYDFKTHSRLEETETVVPKDAILFEGIFGLYDLRLRELMDIKIFVNTDDDTRLGRRLIRDVNERGRQVEGILTQYNRFVKPSYDEFIKPTMQYSDIIVPRGRDNKVALDFIVTNLKLKIGKLARRDSFSEKEESRSIRVPLDAEYESRTIQIDHESPEDFLVYFNLISDEKRNRSERFSAYCRIIFGRMLNSFTGQLEEAEFLTSTCEDAKKIDDCDLAIFCPFLMSSPDLTHMNNLLHKYGPRENSSFTVFSLFVTVGFAKDVLVKYPNLKLIYAFSVADDDIRVSPTPERELQINGIFKQFLKYKNMDHQQS